MIGIELGAPSARVARLNWRLIHMASEGLFPQLIVIPLHRDHGVITMAAGKNDVIKLLPPLTLCESEAHSFLAALDAVLAECHGSCEPELGRRPRDRDCAPSVARPARSSGERADAPLPSRPPTPPTTSPPAARGRLPAHRRDRVHRWAPGRAARCTRAARCAASSARAATRRSCEALDVEIAVGDLTERGLTRSRGDRLPLRVPLRRARVGLGHRRGDRPRQRRRHAEPARGLRRRLRAALHPFQHHRCLRLSRRRGDR